MDSQSLPEHNFAFWIMLTDADAAHASWCWRWINVQRQTKAINGTQQLCLITKRYINFKQTHIKEITSFITSFDFLFQSRILWHMENPHRYNQLGSAWLGSASSLKEDFNPQRLGLPSSASPLRMAWGVGMEKHWNRSVNHGFQGGVSIIWSNIGEKRFSITPSKTMNHLKIEEY